MEYNELLDNALSLLEDVLEDDDYICEKLMDIPEENKYCSENCTEFKRDCILRYLRYYNKEKGADAVE